MGGNQSFPRVKIPAEKFVKNMSSTIKPREKQSDQQEVRSRNALENGMFQQQHTLAKRIQEDKIRFKR